MEVILKKDIENLGKAGQIVRVKSGYARNFLLPKGLAVLVTAANLSQLEKEKQKQFLEKEKEKQNALQLKEKIEKLSFTIPVLTHDEDKLYGKIGISEIINALKEEGIHIDKEKIILDKPLDALGIYSIPIKLHPEVTAQIKVWIVKK